MDGTVLFWKRLCYKWIRIGIINKIQVSFLKWFLIISCEFFKLIIILFFLYWDKDNKIRILILNEKCVVNELKEKLILCIFGKRKHCSFSFTVYLYFNTQWFKNRSLKNTLKCFVNCTVLKFILLVRQVKSAVVGQIRITA